MNNKKKLVQRGEDEILVDSQRHQEEEFARLLFHSKQFGTYNTEEVWKGVTTQKAITATPLFVGNRNGETRNSLATAANFKRKHSEWKNGNYFLNIAILRYSTAAMVPNTATKNSRFFQLTIEHFKHTTRRY